MLAAPPAPPCGRLRSGNARLARLRVLVPLNHAIVGIDLADKKQMVVVTDHDSKVPARKTFRCRAWDLGAANPPSRRVWLVGPDAGRATTPVSSMLCMVFLHHPVAVVWVR